jgi:hypothetical protein
VDPGTGSTEFFSLSLPLRFDRPFPGVGPEEDDAEDAAVLLRVYSTPSSISSCFRRLALRGLFVEDGRADELSLVRDSVGGEPDDFEALVEFDCE